MSLSAHDTWQPLLPPQQSQSDLLAQGVLGRRFCAFLIDGLICSAILCALWVVLFGFGLLTLGLGLPLLGILPAVPFLYNWISLASPLSGTPGQWLVGLAVRRDRDLGPPTPLEALVWTAGFAVTVSLGAIWFGFALLTVRHRALHDIVAGLVVLRRAGLDTTTLTAPPAVWDAARGSSSYV